MRPRTEKEEEAKETAEMREVAKKMIALGILSPAYTESCTAEEKSAYDELAYAYNALALQAGIAQGYWKVTFAAYDKQTQRIDYDKLIKAHSA